MNDICCACGRPLHYSSSDIEAAVKSLIAHSGQYVKVTRLEDGRAWMVQRHYIALHGLKAADLGTAALPNFEEAP